MSSPRRTRLWELSRYLHCSVIGTCLTTSELRHTLAKAGFVTEGATDHDLHGKGVTVAGQQDTAGKLLHKALDKRHRQAISEFAKAKSENELSHLWRETMSRGEIPGAYWAALTHPEATDDLVRQMFGEVHMLSHLVGAANVVRLRGDALGKDNWRRRGEDVLPAPYCFQRVIDCAPRTWLSPARSAYASSRSSVGFIAFGRPIVATLAGACDEQPLTLQLPAGFTLEKSKGIRQFLLADLARGPDGTSIVIPWPQQSPATLSPLAGARGLIVLPESCTTVAPGDAVMFVPLDAFLQ